jgi:hypothetical protein
MSGDELRNGTWSSENQVTQHVSKILDTTLRACSTHKSNFKSLCKHGSFDASSLSYDLFYAGTRKIKNKVKCVYLYNADSSVTNSCCDSNKSQINLEVYPRLSVTSRDECSELCNVSADIAVTIFRVNVW